MKRCDEVRMGDTFSRLVVVEPTWTKPEQKGGQMVRVRWARVLCVCGTVKEVRVYSLRDGSTKSCGCLRAENFQSQTTGGEDA